MTAERCDSRIWSGACEHETYATLSEKYLCDACGTISTIDHEMVHDGSVYLDGDDRSLG